MNDQKLVDIAFDLVATVSDPKYTKVFKKMGLPGRMEWVARQLRLCGFPTRPVGASWGMLEKK